MSLNRSRGNNTVEEVVIFDIYSLQRCSNIKPSMRSDRFRPHHQRSLDPQRKRLLIRPILTLLTQLKVILEQQRRQNEPHLMHSHVLAKTISRSKSEGLVSLPYISSILRIRLEPSLWYKGIGVLEV